MNKNLFSLTMYLVNNKYLYILPTNINIKWNNDYLFDYDNIDKETILQFLQIQNN